MKTTSRRQFLHSLAATPVFGTMISVPALGSIDRYQLVTRHNPRISRLDPQSPLSVGNGEFAFTADLTGLQTFPRAYENAMPLCTMSQWGWHTVPGAFERKDLRLTQYDTFGRRVGYAVDSDGQKALYDWLRENPHRLHLGQIGLRLLRKDGSEASPADLSNCEQILNLWTGILTSSFEFEGAVVIVKTAVHPTLDAVAAIVESSLIASGRLLVRLLFPYGSSSMQAAEWGQPAKHESTLSRVSNRRACLSRSVDGDHYAVDVCWNQDATLSKGGRHEFLLRSTGTHLSLTAWFAPSRRPAPPPSPKTVLEACRQHWPRFWSTGGAIELARSEDKRALELERRIVLSQYLTAINCSGSLPPQETGLTVNSWYGKFHLEMHWWHAAHFALWNRLPLLERSLGYYRSILPQARELARSQGYRGARWPKMTSIDGYDSPSQIGPLLIWQQPHPIFYAELCYRNRKDRRTLDLFQQVVTDTADFMASFAHFQANGKRYVLGPPVIPAQENHPPRETWNPTFELSYWLFGLKTAQKWRLRMGLRRNPKWDDVIMRLSALPVGDGVYLAHENCPQTFTDRNRDHPSMLGAFGMLPGDGVDQATMLRTLHRTLRDWRWDDTWGWDYPMIAMTAARLGEPEMAVSALMMETAKNRYLPNGHNFQRSNLPCYLPGNGGLLYAVAMMASGWNGSAGKRAPGFPTDGKWQVNFENLATAI